MQVKWLRNAAKNLNDATEYIADDNPKVAREFFFIPLKVLINWLNIQILGEPAESQELGSWLFWDTRILFRTVLRTEMWKYCEYLTRQECGLKIFKLYLLGINSDS